VTPARLRLLGELLTEYRAEHGAGPHRRAYLTAVWMMVDATRTVEEAELLADATYDDPWLDSYDEAGR